MSCNPLIPNGTSKPKQLKHAFAHPREARTRRYRQPLPEWGSGLKLSTNLPTFREVHLLYPSCRKVQMLLCILSASLIIDHRSTKCVGHTSVITLWYYLCEWGASRTKIAYHLCVVRCAGFNVEVALAGAAIYIQRFPKTLSKMERGHRIYIYNSKNRQHSKQSSKHMYEAAKLKVTVGYQRRCIWELLMLLFPVHRTTAACICSAFQSHLY
jgi:hypothetical protein